MNSATTSDKLRPCDISANMRAALRASRTHEDGGRYLYQGQRMHDATRTALFRRGLVDPMPREIAPGVPGYALTPSGVRIALQIETADARDFSTPALPLDEETARFLRGVVEDISEADAYSGRGDQARLAALWERLHEIVGKFDRQ